jgi:hypothetical protein
MHEDESCSEYQLRNARSAKHEEASLEEVAKISKPCPKCGSKLNKAGGCDHMTCEYSMHDLMTFSRISMRC